MTEGEEIFRRAAVSGHITCPIIVAMSANQLFKTLFQDMPF